MNSVSRLEGWVDMYDERLLRLAYAYVRDWAFAEDKVQEAFVKAYRVMHQLRDQDNPFPWLARIVINECKTTMRKQSWRVLITMLLPEPKTSSAEEEYFTIADTRQIHDGIMALPLQYRV